MRAEARIAVIGILALNLSVPEFLALQQLTPQERKAALHLPAACAPQMTAMKTAFVGPDGSTWEVRCAEPAPKARPGFPGVRARRARAGPGWNRRPSRPPWERDRESVLGRAAEL